MFLKTLTTSTVWSRSTLVTSNTKVIDLIYHATLAHYSMKDTEFKIVSAQAVRAVELLLYNFSFTDPFICYSRHVTTYKLPSQRIPPPPPPPHNVTNHHQVMPNVKFEVVCQYEHNTAIRNTAY